MRYMGSKSRIAKDIVPIIQRYIDENKIRYYIEPFIGGGNIIDKVKCHYKYGYDINKYLIALLQHVQNDGSLYEEVTKDLWDKANQAYKIGNQSEFEDWQIGCIGFLRSYGARFFDGGFANDTSTRDRYQEGVRNIKKQAENPLFKDIILGTSDYKDLKLEGMAYKTVIYCDPPYYNKKTYSKYKIDYDEFWEIMRKWSQAGHIVLISEMQAPDDFECIWEKEVKRTLSADSNNIKATEKLFKYKG